MNILIVDDHPLFRHALIQAVRYSLPQAQIQETADVDEFYERLEHGAEPDLVLLDLNLPAHLVFLPWYTYEHNTQRFQSLLYQHMKKSRLSNVQLHMVQWGISRNHHTQVILAKQLNMY
jgi:DNA-binding NarL/FixJ family response regulator